jgi:hypothetical protein
MISPPELPSLFGRFTALHRDHHHLDGLVKKLSTMCDALSERPDVAPPPELDPAQLIPEWGIDLSRHFAAEEGMRYFGTLVAERPALASAIGDLRADHTAMLEAIERLLQLAPDRERRDELVLGTRDLLDRFRAHERAENQLLREFFDAYGRDKP